MGCICFFVVLSKWTLQSETWVTGPSAVFLPKFCFNLYLCFFLSKKNLSLFLLCALTWTLITLIYGRDLRRQYVLYNQNWLLIYHFQVFYEVNWTCGDPFSFLEPLLHLLFGRLSWEAVYQHHQKILKLGRNCIISLENMVERFPVLSQELS